MTQGQQFMRQFALAIGFTSLAFNFLALSWVGREREVVLQQRGEIWLLQGERDTYKHSFESISAELADLKAVPAVVCPEPVKPKPPKKPAKRPTPVFPRDSQTVAH